MFDFSVVNDSGSNLVNSNPTVIKVIGCGGGGCNAVDNMIKAGIENVEFVALNTDVQTLGRSLAPVKIAIGQKQTGGLGAGGNPKIGEQSAEEDKEAIKNEINGANMVFITAGMGGGTGTGSAPVVARIAKESGALTVCVVTTPFDFEGPQRMDTAMEGIKNLRTEVDSLIVVPNQKLINKEKKLTYKQSFLVADDVLRQGVKGISDIVTKPGVINTDFADVKSAMEGQGEALLGIGVGTGENRAVDAATNAINNNLLEDSRIDDAKNLLVNITGNEDVLMEEIDDIMRIIRSSADPKARIFWGQVENNDMGDEISVTVIATGFKKGTTTERIDQEEKAAAEPQEPKLPEDKIGLDDYRNLINGNSRGRQPFNPSRLGDTPASEKVETIQQPSYGSFVSGRKQSDTPLFDNNDNSSDANAQNLKKDKQTTIDFSYGKFSGSSSGDNVDRSIPKVFRDNPQFSNKIRFQR